MKLVAGSESFVLVLLLSGLAGLDLGLGLDVAVLAVDDFQLEDE